MDLELQNDKVHRFEAEMIELAAADKGDREVSPAFSDAIFIDYLFLFAGFLFSMILDDFEICYIIEN